MSAAIDSKNSSVDESSELPELVVEGLRSGELVMTEISLPEGGRAIIAQSTEFRQRLDAATRKFFDSHDIDELVFPAPSTEVDGSTPENIHVLRPSGAVGPQLTEEQRERIRQGLERVSEQIRSMPLVSTIGFSDHSDSNNKP